MKDLQEARSELSVVLVRYRSLAGINGSEEHAKRAGVSVNTVKYVKEKRFTEPKPPASDVRKIFRVLNLTVGFHAYVLELINMVFPEPVVTSKIPFSVRRLRGGRERASV